MSNQVIPVSPSPHVPCARGPARGLGLTLYTSSRQPVVFPRAIAEPLASLLCWLFFAAAAHASAATVPELISLDRIDRQRFEPAVDKQIHQAYRNAQRRPRNAEAVGKLGMIFQVYEKFELAELCYQRAAALDPDSFRWAYYLGNVQGWRGDHERAIQNLRRALQQDPHYEPAWLRLGELLFAAGLLGESARTYGALVDQNPALAAAHFGLGRTQAARHHWSAAIQSYLRAIERYRDYGAAHYALAMAYRRTGEAGKAREHLQRHQSVKEAAPGPDDPLMAEVHALYEGGRALVAEGSRLAREGKLEQAAAAFESALETNPRLTVAHSNLIVMYGELGRIDKAEEHYRAAIQISPKWAEAYYNWGTILARATRPREATEALREAVRLNRDYADARVQWGMLLDDAGRHKEAARQYQLALRSNPNHRHAHYLFGRSLAASGRSREGIKHLEQTIQQNDARTPVYMQALSFVYEHIGRRDKALEYAREAQERARMFQMADLVMALQRDIERLGAGAPSP